ncbi:mobilisation protein (MobC) [Micromonospora sediminicola]|uniref:Mobilisation protein (MobC) n=1 Tax=Micromonospora sediminicola TaxID=946078 RepID=A0A1A9BJE1_9ACTN|nr:plasmid mobilization relaxosome protein MobC [Micromonospora sediminicola]SBT69313.1 mobilisation protein (MobC) [Micromonospora sediminicola]
MVRGGPVRRTRDVRVRLSPGEHATWTAAREATGRRELGAWVRAVVNELLARTPGASTAAGPQRQVDVDAYAALVRAGNNLNQLARWANTQRRYPAEREAAAVYAEVRAAVAEIRAASRTGRR